MEELKKKIAARLYSYVVTEPGRVLENYNGENEKIDDYQGRELFELIQNADDEMTNSSDKTVYISLTSDELIVSNNGNAFTPRGVESLMYSNNSPKKGDNTKIGNKGTGFRSILSWADQVTINSGRYHLVFSPAIAQELYNQEYFKYHNSYPKDRVATLVFPKILDPIPCAYTTEIKLRLKQDNDIKNRILSEINKLEPQVLLFLNNISRIIIKIDNTSVIYQKELINATQLSDNLTIKEYSISNLSTNTTESWLVCESNKVEHKVAVAYCKSNPELSKFKKLHSFLPTSIELPLGVIVHAPLNLTSNRNYLISNNKENSSVLTHTIECFFDFIKYFISTKLYNNSYDALSLVFPQFNTKVNHQLEEYNYSNLFYRELIKCPVFPNVYGTYLHFDANIKYTQNISTVMSTMTNVTNFQSQSNINLRYYTLLPISSNYHGISETQLNNILLRCSIYAGVSKYSPIHSEISLLKMLDECIRITLPIISNVESSVKQLCEWIAYVLKFIEAEYGVISRELITMYKINLMISSNCEQCGSNEFVLFGEKKALDIPSFIDLKRIHPLLEEELSKNTRSGGDVFESYRNYGLLSYSNDVIINRLKAFDNDIEELTNDNLLELFKWYYNNIKSLDSKVLSSGIPMIDLNGKKVMSNKMYYVSSENSFLEDIMVTQCLTRISNQYEQIQLSEFTAFLNAIGVNLLPIMTDYKGKVKDLKYMMHDVLLNSHFNFNENYLYFGNVIPNLIEILTNCSTYDILRWILLDKKLSNEFNNNNGEVKLTNTVLYKTSYIKAIFMFHSWIEIDNKKQSIYYLMDDNVEINNQLTSSCFTKINLKDYLSNFTGNEHVELVRILYGLGIVRKVTDINILQAYNLLTSNVEYLHHKFHEALRQRILRNYNPTRFTSTIIYSSYKRDAKVLCTNDKFVSLSDVSYVIDTNYFDSLKKYYNLIKIQRRDAKNIVSALNINEAKFSYSIKNIPVMHDLNNSFQKDYTNFILSLKINSQSQTLSKMLDKTKITLISKAEIVLNNTHELEIGKYEYISNSNEHYICIPMELSNVRDLKAEIKFQDIFRLILENILRIDNVKEAMELYLYSPESRYEYLSRALGEYELKELMSSYNNNHDSMLILAKFISSGDKELTPKIFNEIKDVRINDSYNVANIEKLISILTKYNVKVSQINDLLITDKIDLVPYYLLKYNDLKSRYSLQYKSYTYEKLISANFEEKMLFLDMLKQYEYKTVEFENEIVNVEELFSNFAHYKIIDNIDGKLKENYKNIESLITYNELIKDNKLSSLVIFGDYEYVIKLINERKSENIMNSQIDCESNYEMVDVRKPSERKSATISYQHTAKTPTNYNKSPLESEIEKNVLGQEGEIKVFESLEKKGFKVETVSYNCALAGKGTLIDDSLGYDMRYTNLDGVTKYVEVKTTTSSNQFHMSENELRVAKEKYPNYEIHFVSKNTRKIEVISSIYIETPNGLELNAELFNIIVKKEYTFRFK